MYLLFIKVLTAFLEAQVVTLNVKGHHIDVALYMHVFKYVP